MSLPPFHLALPVDDLAAARRFYGGLLGCPEGRSAEHWIDFDLHGHQLVAHLAPGAVRPRAANPVDGEQVPVPANIGIDTRSGYHSPLHTHTPNGVIHFEADEPSPFTLQQVFSMWGVEFTADRLGAYTPTGDNQIHVYVNGQPIDDPVTYELQQGDNIVVAYGEAGSFPTEPPDDALANS